jgi:hypothetical protein
MPTIGNAERSVVRVPSEPHCLWKLLRDNRCSKGGSRTRQVADRPGTEEAKGQVGQAQGEVGSDCVEVERIPREVTRPTDWPTKSDWPMHWLKEGKLS